MNIFKLLLLLGLLCQVSSRRKLRSDSRKTTPGPPSTTPPSAPWDDEDSTDADGSSGSLGTPSDVMTPRMTTLPPSGPMNNPDHFPFFMFFVMCVVMLILLVLIIYLLFKLLSRMRGTRRPLYPVSRIYEPPTGQGHSIYKNLR
ncbi:hypothetical protein [Saguinine gammaherpesvirus 1]|uniref:Uncharacterized protein n=1 Tax=Saguinine gammaherpesvirus 1 TaxID=2169901 RepID=A0A9Q8VJ93_9GAMA|nr:hypothetical protein [Saguinine gammaherpesvirus 1]